MRPRMPQSQGWSSTPLSSVYEYQGVKNLDLGHRKRLPSKELRPIRGTRRRKFFVASDLR